MLHICQICYEFLVWNGLAKVGEHFSSDIGLIVGRMSINAATAHAWLWYLLNSLVSAFSLSHCKSSRTTFTYIKQYKKKQSPSGVTIKRWSENMHQIYRRTPTLMCDFSKVLYFQNNFYRKNFWVFPPYKNVSWEHPIIITGIFFWTFLRHALVS